MSGGATGGGVVAISASGVVNDSGKPQRVYGLNIDSKATGGVVNLRNGTSSSAPIYFTGTGTASVVSGIANFPAEGILFPSGCYCSIDSNVNNAYVICEQVESA